MRDLCTNASHHGKLPSPHQRRLMPVLQGYHSCEQKLRTLLALAASSRDGEAWALERRLSSEPNSAPSLRQGLQPHASAARRVAHSPVASIAAKQLQVVSPSRVLHHLRLQRGAPPPHLPCPNLQTSQQIEHRSRRPLRSHLPLPRQSRCSGHRQELRNLHRRRYFRHRLLLPFRQVLRSLNHD